MVEEQPQRYMKLTAKDDIKGLRLLESGRIDYLITFPFVLQQHIESMDFIKELHSFSFRFYDQPMPSYIACSQSPEGQGFVSAVNKLMNNSSLRKGLVDIIVKKMIPTDRESLAEAFQQLYSDAD